MKKVAAVATAALAGIGVASAVKSIGEIGIKYQDTMNNLQAVSGATAKQMAAVGATAKQLGSDTKLTATSAADAAVAMTELAKGGLTVDAAMQAARGTLQLASAAGIDAATAATIQSAALNAYALSADQAGHVSDVLANAANSAAGEITDFSDGLQQSGAVAHALGISLEDTSAALGILANNGIKGSDAGTLLKSALLALESPSKQARDAMDDLGLKAFDAQGNFVGLDSIFGQLQTSSQRMTKEQYAAATSTLFGSDAARLAGVAAKEGSGGFEAMAAAMGKSGSAADVAAAKSKGVGGAIEALKSQFETIAIVIFEKVAPAVEGGLRAVGKAVEDASAWFSGTLAPAIQGIYDLVVNGDFTGKFAKVFHVEEDSPIVGFLLKVHDVLDTVVTFVRDNATPILAGLGAALAVIAAPAVIGAIGTLATAIGGALAGAFAFLVSPIALAALAIGGIVAIFIKAYQESEPLRAAVDKLKSAFGVFFDAFDKANGEGGISGFFDGLKAGISAAAPIVLSALSDMGKALWSWIKDNIGPALVQLGEWLAAIGSWVLNTGLPALGGFLADLGQALVDWIGPRIGPMLAAIGEFLGSLTGWIWNTGLPWLLDAVGGLAKSIVDWIVPQIPGLLGKLGEFLGAAVGWVLGTGIPLLIGAMFKMSYELIAWVLPRLPELLANFTTFIASTVVWILTVGLPTLAKGLFDMAWEAIKSFWEAIEQSPLMQKLGDIFGSIVGIAQRVWGDVKGAFITGINDVIGLINQFLDAVNAIAGKVGIDLGLHVKPIGIDFGGAPVGPGTSGGRNIALASGGIVENYANGGVRENHVAQIAKAGTWRVWAEDETGGEAYIPLHPSKRRRSMAIWRETGKRLGADVDFNADGGVYSQLFGRVKQQFPSAILTSGYRAGDPGYHGKGLAADIGFAGNNPVPLAAANQWLYDSFKGGLLELIYDGPGDSRPDVKNGADHTYNASTRADHTTHVHLAAESLAAMLSGKGGGGGGGFAEVVREILGDVAQKAVDPIKSGITSITSSSPLLGMMGGAANLAIQSVVDMIRKKDDEAAAASDGGGSAGAGVQQWSGTVSKALSMLGQPQGLIQTVLRRMQQESGGNPRAINLTDSNAKKGTPSKGLMQVIDPTFQTYRDRALSSDIYDPMANIVASMNYTLSRYGSLPAGYNRAGGYARGTMLASRGLHLVGESGPELVDFRGGESVLTAPRTRDVLATGGTQGPMIGTLVLQPAPGESTQDQIERVNFEMRRLRRGGRGLR